MRAQIAKQRRIVGGDALPDHRDAKPAHGGSARAAPPTATALHNPSPRFAKGVQLVRRPKIGGLLLHKLRGLIDPVEMLELLRRA